MNKIVMFALAAVIAAPLFAEEKTEEQKKESQKEEQQQPQERKRESTVWPAFFAVSEFPASPDVLGLRLTIPFSTKQDSITGLDVGLWGRALYFEGIQVNVLRCDIKDRGTGIQVGLYNTIGTGEILGFQCGLWNEACSLRGFQVGLVNAAGEAQGFQVGLINRSEALYGYQVGLINVIRSAELQFCPVLNIGF